jgi:putative oxidoreductase
MFIYLATYSDTALLVLRLALGGILIAHGWPKLRNLKQTAESFDQMGFKPGALFGGIAAFLELFGGIAIILGFMVQSVAVLFAVEFVVILVWRLAKKHSFVGGWELDALILGAVLLLLSLGAGAYSAGASFFLFGF